MSKQASAFVCISSQLVSPLAYLTQHVTPHTDTNSSYLSLILPRAYWSHGRVDEYLEVPSRDWSHAWPGFSQLRQNPLTVPMEVQQPHSQRKASFDRLRGLTYFDIPGSHISSSLATKDLPWDPLLLNDHFQLCQDDGIVPSQPKNWDANSHDSKFALGHFHPRLELFIHHFIRSLPTRSFASKKSQTIKRIWTQTVSVSVSAGFFFF